MVHRLSGRAEHRRHHPLKQLPQLGPRRAAELPDGWTSGRLHLALGGDGAVLAPSAVDVDTHTGFVIGDDRS
ncbi:hypothetical protein ABZW11_11680 [Nonomuraea sp. NPDC004580]|uniref:hypothetical protein n=1 Tax=Nonomuraea sp. NPDC004580 TaxID=3154552 RepID=UPI0033BC60E8